MRSNIKNLVEDYNKELLRINDEITEPEDAKKIWREDHELSVESSNN
jgi:hypothetical protein